MEIRNIHVLNHNATGYLCTWTSIEKRDRIWAVNTRIFRRIHCNLETIVNSLPSPRDFSQLGFHVKILSPCLLFVCEFLRYLYFRDAKSTPRSIVSENLYHILVLSLRAESLHLRSLPPKIFLKKFSSRSMMALRKRITDGATCKGKAIATAGGKASLPTNNQPCAENTGSILPQEPFASVQSSQQ